MNKIKFAPLLILLHLASALSATAAGPLASTAQKRVQGIVSFEQRNGIAPGSLAPMSYWSVVVQDHGVAYELPKVLAVDSGLRPESATIQGTVVRAGDQVTVVGSVQQIRSDFRLLSNITRVDSN